MVKGVMSKFQEGGGGGGFCVQPCVNLDNSIARGYNNNPCPLTKIQKPINQKLYSFYLSDLMITIIIASYPGLIQIKGMVHTVFWHALVCHRNACPHIDHFSWKSVKIQRMREQCVPGPFMGRGWVRG